jgi:cell wall-associated NlpC family hydrolase
LGTPYEYGSDREESSTFDCSDFAQWVYGEALGLSIPRDSRSQAEYVRSRGSRVYGDPRDARPGDLLFFRAYRGNARTDYDGRRDGTITHVAIALGNGRVIHTLSEDTGGVRIDSLSDNHLEYRFVFGGTLMRRADR